MKDSEVLLSGIEYKIKKIIGERNALFSENKELTNTITELKLELKTKQEIINNLKYEIKVSNTAKLFINNKDVENARQEIDDLVREIDKSIKLLNK